MIVATANMKNRMLNSFFIGFILVMRFDFPLRRQG